MGKDPIVQKISILGSMDYRPNTPGNHDILFGVPRRHAWGTTTSHPGYHDITLGVPSKGILLNVYTIKGKPQILYFNLLLIVNIMNTYFTYFVRIKGHFMTLKHL